MIQTLNSLQSGSKKQHNSR